MYLRAKPPNMLPTQPLTGTNVSNPFYRMFRADDTGQWTDGHYP